MKLFKVFLIFTFVGIILMSFTKHEKMKFNNNDPYKELGNFPVAGEGMTRYVIFLKKKSNENDFKIELIPGKIMNVDCNFYTLLGNMEEKNLDGWGYNYYQYTSSGEAMSTMMACPEQTKTNKFVAGKSIWVDYNSKLPIVIYVPKGIEVNYKIWKAGKESSAEEK
ncbi:serine protease inhibitor ecotin [Apibacter muscae]|nr:serine protease inhibitor ecotin [Apibacter muscae]